MWVRGLKLWEKLPIYLHKVAPHVGAWIETQHWRSQMTSNLSHPMWVRGLKQ